MSMAPMSGTPKRTLYGQFAAGAEALAHEHRLELSEVVAEGRARCMSNAGRPRSGTHPPAGWPPGAPAKAA
jgi:hypothetical protein